MLNKWLICLVILSISFKKSFGRFPILFGFTIMSSDVKFENDIQVIYTSHSVLIYFYGLNLENVEYIAFTNESNLNAFDNCDLDRSTPSFTFKKIFDVYRSEIVLYGPRYSLFYICLGIEYFIIEKNYSYYKWFHQGKRSETTIMIFQDYLPLWLKIILIVIMFSLSALFSGLNLGLMTLSLTDLQLFEEAGSDYEKHCAKIIRPVRNYGNFLLVTLLLGNVLVNSALTILIDDLVSNGIVTIIAATLGIVLLGEIIPQAVFSRYSLAIGANTMFITKLFMFITFPLSFPIGWILDKVLGKEVGIIYSRDKLEALLREQQDKGAVVKEEVDIITGALSLTTKTVHSVMTPFENVFMIPIDSVLNFTLLNEILHKGYSRIPVYSENKHNIVAILNVKDLTLVDPDDSITTKTICSFYNRPIVKVPSNTLLKDMLDEFKKGKTHLAFVEENGKMIGLLTLEDVIEEIIQAEIVDETDLYVDNRLSKRTSIDKTDFTVFEKQSKISPQLKLLAFQHLMAEVPAFKEHVNFNVLKSFLNSDVVIDIDCNLTTPREVDERINMGNTVFNGDFIIKRDIDVNYALLLVNGRVGVSIGNEKLFFETGSFVMFCETVLNNVIQEVDIKSINKSNFNDIVELLNTKCKFKPNYDVVALTDLQLIVISIEHYIACLYLTVKKPNMKIDRIFSEDSRNSRNSDSQFHQPFLEKLFRTTDSYASTSKLSPTKTIRSMKSIHKVFQTAKINKEKKVTINPERKSINYKRIDKLFHNASNHHIIYKFGSNPTAFYRTVTKYV